MSGRCGRASAVSARSIASRAATVASLTVIALLAAGPLSWAAGSDSEATTAAAPAPELLGIPLLTLVWALTGVLAIVAGLTIASRGHRRPAGRLAVEQRTDHALPGNNHQGTTP